MTKRELKRTKMNKYFREFAKTAEKHSVDDGVPDSKYGVKVKSKNGDTLTVYPFLLHDLFLSERRRGVALTKIGLT